MDPVSAGLDVLSPQVFPVPYCGEVLEVGPLTIGQVPVLVRQARPLVDAVLDLPDDADLMGAVLNLVEHQGEALIAAIAIAVGRSPEFISKGRLDEFHALSFKVFEVNRDFFVQTLGPHLARARGKHGAGQIASSA